MTFGSLFSGIGGIDLGLERAGMRVAFQCEADEWRRSVLVERFPGTPCSEDVALLRPVAHAASGRNSHGDVAGARASKLAAVAERHEVPAVDLLCGGFPCQDLSIAGRRKGLIDGERSSLFFEFARIADELVRPGGYVLVENVPGLLSSNGGRDFAVVLATLAELGFHDLAWRVLDSRHFGVPQRRRRVFIVGRRARGDRCASLLLESSGGGGHFAARGEAREGVAGTLGGVSGERGWAQDTERMTFVADTLTSGSHPGSNMPGRRREDDTNIVIQGGAQQDQFVTPEGISPTLAHASNTHQGNHQPKVFLAGSTSFSENQRGEVLETDYAHQLTSGGGKPGQGYGAVRVDSAVRRLTPRECERLQGFPDDWTALGPDSRRYAALGDAVTVPVAEWIGRRIMEAEAVKAA